MKLTEGVKINRGENIDEGLAVQAMIHPEMKTVLKFEEAMSLFNHTSGTVGKYAVVEAYTNMYQRVSSNRRSMIMSVNSIRDSIYLADVILDQFVEDALAPEVSTGQIFNLEYKGDKKLDEALKKFEKDTNLDSLILEAAPDILAYGEYYFKLRHEGEEIHKEIDELGGKQKEFIIKKNGKGVTGILDIVDQGTIVSLVDNGEIKAFLYSEEDKIIRTGKESFWRVGIHGKRYRVGLEESLPFSYKKEKSKALEKLLGELPRFVRIGRSMIYPYISKLKELDLLEKLVPATKLSKLSNVNLVGLNVPGSYDVEKGLLAARKVENVINNRIGVDKRLNELTVESIIGTAGRTKVIPTFGDKGGLDKIDFNSDEPDEMLSAIEDLRRVICDSIGVPYEILYKSDTENKGELLRRYAKYLRKLKNFQRSLIEAIRELCCIHLKALGIENFDKDLINVEFLNKLVEIDNIDRLEHADITINNTSNVRDFFNDMVGAESPYRELVNLEVVAEFINKQLKTIGLDGAIILKSEGGKGEIQLPKTEEPDVETGGEDDIDTELDSADDSELDLDKE